MRGITTAALALGLALALPMAATAAPPDPQRQINRLKERVSSLTARVTTLTNQVETLSHTVSEQTAQIDSANAAAVAASTKVDQLTARVARNEDVMLCLFALGSDIDAGLFNLIAIATGSSSRITNRVDDQGTCARAGINRPAYSIMASSPFSPVAALIQSASLPR